MGSFAMTNGKRKIIIIGYEDDVTPIMGKKEAGDRYSFRYDQLNLFIARGIEARLSAIEDKLGM